MDGLRPKAVATNLTSTFSQSIGEKLGMVANGSVVYDETIYDGKKMSERIRDPRHKTVVVMTKLL